MLTLDGAYGEGGGQIVRTALTLAALLSRPIRLVNIRANRTNPGLAAQHLTAVLAAAMICDATVTGATLGSTELTFEPQSPPIPGDYLFDVAEAREGGSAGSTVLVLQTILLPLMLAAGPSNVTVRGGTHVSWSPSFHYFDETFLSMLARLELQATAQLDAWGWYPAGEGEITVEIPGQTSSPADLPRPDGPTLTWTERGPLEQVEGLAIASSLPSHIAQRMWARTTNLLEEAEIPAAVEPRRVRSVSPGAGIFLTAKYQAGRAGFTALGRKGKPSEEVAAEAVDTFLAFHHSQAVIDKHLTDQLILPAAVCGSRGHFSSQQLTEHTLTNIWVVQQFLGPVVAARPEKNLVEFTPGG